MLNKERTEPRHEGLKEVGGQENWAIMGYHASCEGTRTDLRGTPQTPGLSRGAKTLLAKKIFVLFSFAAYC